MAWLCPLEANEKARRLRCSFEDWKVDELIIPDR